MRQPVRRPMNSFATNYGACEQWTRHSRLHGTESRLGGVVEDWCCHPQAEEMRAEAHEAELARVAEQQAREAAERQRKLEEAAAKQRAKVCLSPPPPLSQCYCCVTVLLCACCLLLSLQIAVPMARCRLQAGELLRTCSESM